MISMELSVLYSITAFISIFFGIAIIYIFFRKVLTINRGSAAKQPVFYSMVSSLIATLAFVISTIIMLVITFNKQTTLTVGCSILAALEHFFLLFYFLWLMITVLMNYFTIKFQLNNFSKFFKPLVALSFCKCNHQAICVVAFIVKIKI